MGIPTESSKSGLNATLEIRREMPSHLGNVWRDFGMKHPA